MFFAGRGRTIGSLAGPMLVAALAVPALAWGVPAIAQASMAMLGKVDSGAWEIRARDDRAARRICVRDGMDLVQLRHRGNCKRTLVEGSTDHVTVQYTCRGNGYGRTSLRRETATLVQLRTEGIANGRPFSFAGEARRVGACK